MKSLVWIFMFVGSAIGGALPMLWGDSFFGMWSVVLTAVLGIIGIYVGFKLGN